MTTDAITDTAVAALAEGLLGSTPPKDHGQICPIWVTRNLTPRQRARRASECDCHVGRLAHEQAVALFAALTPEARDNALLGPAVAELPQNADHSLEYLAPDPTDVPPFDGGWMCHVSNGYAAPGVLRPSTVGEGPTPLAAVTAALGGLAR